VGMIYLLYYSYEILMCVTSCKVALKCAIEHYIEYEDLEYDGGHDIDKFSNDFDTKDVDYINDRLSGRIGIIEDGQYLF